MKVILKKLLGGLGYTLQKRDAAPVFRNAYRDMQYLLRSVRQPVIFDVGAYHGYVARDMRRLFPEADIIAIEADPRAFAQLRTNCGEDRAMRLINLAVSDCHGEVKFHRNENAATNSILPLTQDPDARSNWAHATGFECVETISVETTTIDSLAAQLEVDRIDLLKLDVQGAELKVLDGALQLLSRNSVRCVYAEMLMEESYLNQPLPSKFLTAFENHGFRVFNIYNLMNAPSGMLLQCDVLFVRSGSVV